jgi:hypothetical protein
MVHQRDALPLGHSPELGVVRDELMEPRHDVQTRVDRRDDRAPPRRRDPAARRRDADEQGARPQRQGLLQGLDHRDVVALPEPLTRVPAGAGRVEHRHDVVRPVADHAQRGLGAGLAELALGEDDVAVSRVGTHGPGVYGATGAA